MSEAVKAAERRLKAAQKRLDKAKEALDEATEDLITAESEVEFTCLECGHSAPYSKLTLVHSCYTERGLGMSDDYELFAENQIECSECKMNHRFLSQEALDRFKIPYKAICHYGRPMHKQHTTREFNNKFKKVVERLDERGYKFINIYK